MMKNIVLCLLAITNLSIFASGEKDIYSTPKKEREDAYHPATPVPWKENKEYIFDAARQGNLGVVKREVERDDSLINAINSHGDTLLVCAMKGKLQSSRGDHERVVKYLLAKGADCNLKGPDRNSKSADELLQKDRFKSLMSNWFIPRSKLDDSDKDEELIDSGSERNDNHAALKKDDKRGTPDKNDKGSSKDDITDEDLPSFQNNKEQEPILHMQMSPLKVIGILCSAGLTALVAYKVLQQKRQQQHVR
jgi:hypothetical protein